MKIFSFISEQSGVGYYRIWTPLKMLEEQNRIEWLHNPFSEQGRLKDYWLPISEEGFKHTFKKLEKLIGSGKTEKSPDAFLMQRHDQPFYFSMCLGLKQVYQVPIIQETDDYVYDVPPTNLGIKSYHERPDTASPDINDAITWSRKALGHYDGYIVTTKFLKNFYDNFAPTHICPNSIDLRTRPANIPHKKHKEIRLAFSSSGGHQSGLYMLEPVIDELMKKYPNLVFYYYKGLIDIFSKKPYKNRVKKMKWVSMENYPKYLHDLDFDVVVAPLQDRSFNRAKSNLRLLEYWTSGKYPIVASPVGEYKSTIKDGKNGMLAKDKDEWINKISLLIENKELAKKCGEEGYQTVVKDYNLEKNAKLWQRAISDISSRYNKTDYLAPGKSVIP